MEIPVSNLNSWSQVVTGSGSLVIDNDGRTAILDAVAGSGSQLTINLLLSPTGRVKVDFMARKIRGISNAWVHDKNSIVNSVQVDSDLWQHYSIVGCSKIFSDHLNSYFRVNIGVATADDGAVEISDVKVSSIASDFGQLECLASGTVFLTNGAISSYVNMAGIEHVSLSDSFNLAVSVPKINSSLKTPVLSCTRIDNTGVETPGDWRPRFYDKAAGIIHFRFFEHGQSSPKALSGVTAAFSFKAEVV